MSRRREIEMTDDEVREFLAAHRVLQVATLNADGTPHLVTMWYGLLDGRVAFWSYGKAQKVVNLRRDPRFAVHVEDGDTYDALRGVTLNGRAVILDDPDDVLAFGIRLHLRDQPPGTEPSPDARARIAAQAAKRVVIVMEPERVISWDHSKLR